MGISHASYTGEAPAIGRVDNLFDPLIRAPLVAASIVITFQSGLRAPRSRRIRGALSQPSTSATMFAGTIGGATKEWSLLWSESCRPLPALLPITVPSFPSRLPLEHLSTRQSGVMHRIASCLLIHRGRVNNKYQSLRLGLCARACV